MAKEDIRSYEVVRIMMRSLFDFQLFRLRGWGGGGGEGGKPGNYWWGCAARFSIRRSCNPVVPSKSIPDSRPNWAMCIPVFRLQRRKTLPDGATHTYIAYIREYTPRVPTSPTQALAMYLTYIKQDAVGACIWA